MTHSYDTNVALAVGGAPEAVVLKEIVYWCGRNRDNGGEEHDGRYWMFMSLEGWREKFPEFRGCIDNILRRLEKGGWVVTGVFNKRSFDRTKWYSPSDAAVSLFDGVGIDDAEAPEAPPAKAPSGKSTEAIMRDQSETIDHLYGLYPGKTWSGDRGTRSTGKCSKDKQRIAVLLKTYTPEQIERSITMYVEEQRGQYLKNFSTFLNNIPLYEEDGDQPADKGKQITGQDW